MILGMICQVASQDVFIVSKTDNFKSFDFALRKFNEINGE